MPVKTAKRPRVELGYKRELDAPGQIMVLGPSEYHVPDDVHVIETEPRRVRADLSAYLRDFAQDRATVMEEWTGHPGETQTELFERILHEAPVRAFIVYWPLGAKLLGLEWELGILTQKFHYAGFPPERVYVLAESGILADNPQDGTATVVAIDEGGNRTRYHQDLFGDACKLRLWDNQESLLRHCSEVSLETKALRRWNWDYVSPPAARRS